jgi:hypothetical protein
VRDKAKLKQGGNRPFTSPSNGSKAVVIKMSDLKLASAQEKEKITDGDGKENLETDEAELIQTPIKKQSRLRFSRASLQYNYAECQSVANTEFKEGMKKMLESNDVFNMKNSKIMDSQPELSGYYTRPSSLQKRRHQRKMWQKDINH